MNLYRHFKGGFYRKLLTARDCDNHEQEYTIYEGLQKSNYPKGQNWLRKIEEFDGMRGDVKRMRKLTFKESCMFYVGLRKKIPK